MSRPTSGARGPTGRAPPSSASRTRQARCDAPRPSELERACVLEHEAAPREAVRRRAEQDLSRRGRLLEPCGHVHRLTGHERRVARLVDHELAGLDADARLQAQLVHGGPHRQRGTGRALGVVLVRLRNAEGRENGVAGELLDDAAVERDAV